MPGLRHAHTLQQLQELQHDVFLRYYDVTHRRRIYYDHCQFIYPTDAIIIKYSPGGEYS